ncbi:hypothetical protein RV134_270148 [Roseovarius sp. EC-HK134]|nr:hypothetical protein RV134_270148 [Roseovarius sp. EC-HK134]
MSTPRPAVWVCRSRPAKSPKKKKPSNSMAPPIRVHRSATSSAQPSRATAKQTATGPAPVAMRQTRSGPTDPAGPFCVWGGKVFNSIQPSECPRAEQGAARAAARIAGPSRGLAMLRRCATLRSHTDFAGINCQLQMLRR